MDHLFPFFIAFSLSLLNAARSAAVAPTPAREDPNLCLQVPKPVQCIQNQKKRRQDGLVRHRRKGKNDSFGFEIGTGANLGINQGLAGDEFHWYYGAGKFTFSLRFVWGTGRHFSGIGWEFHTLQKGRTDDAPEGKQYKSLLLYPWYRYQRDVMFFEVAPFVAADSSDFAGMGIFSRVGVMKKVGHWCIGAGLGGGFGLGVQYLNLMVITGFHF